MNRVLKFRRDRARDRVLKYGGRLASDERVRNGYYDALPLPDAEVDQLTRKRDAALEFIRRTA